MSGTVLTGGGLAGYIAAVERRNAATDVAKGCMAQRGYMVVPVTEVAAHNAKNRAISGIAAPTLAHGQVGISLVPVAKSGVKTTAKEGLYVVDVTPSSPAAAAGVLPGDIVTAAGGRKLLSEADFGNVMTSSAGSPVVLRIVRGAGQLELTVTPAS